MLLGGISVLWTRQWRPGILITSPPGNSLEYFSKKHHTSVLISGSLVTPEATRFFGGGATSGWSHWADESCSPDPGPQPAIVWRGPWWSVPWRNHWFSTSHHWANAHWVLTQRQAAGLSQTEGEIKPCSLPAEDWHISWWFQFICHLRDTKLFCHPSAYSIPGLGRSAGEGIGNPLQNSWASLVAQLVKNPPAVQETWVQSLGWEYPLKKGKATHSSILA